MNINLAPIVLFVYNRPLHTKKTIEALLSNQLATESDLIIYADAAKNENSIADVSKVREYIRSIVGFKTVQIVEQKKNLGLAASVIQGVTDVVSKYGKVIVLEDDLVTSPFFLTYMNQALDLYKDDEEVVSIHGYNYPTKMELNETTFFLRGADCWGWATWKRGWDLFNANGSILLAQLVNQNLTREFDFNNSYPYTKMLKDQIALKNDSWAIRWYASAFLKNKYTLYPVKSLVQNIGLDLSGTHSGKHINFNSDFISQETFCNLNKIPVIEEKEAKKRIEQFFRKRTKIGLKQRLINFIAK